MRSRARAPGGRNGGRAPVRRTARGEDVVRRDHCGEERVHVHVADEIDARLHRLLWVEDVQLLSRVTHHPRAAPRAVHVADDVGGAVEQGREEEVGLLAVHHRHERGVGPEEPHARLQHGRELDGRRLRLAEHRHEELQRRPRGATRPPLGLQRRAGPRCPPPPRRPALTQISSRLRGGSALVLAPRGARMAACSQPARRGGAATGAAHLRAPVLQDAAEAAAQIVLWLPAELAPDLGGVAEQQRLVGGAYLEGRRRSGSR